MLRNCACLVIAHMVTTIVWRNMFGRFCSEWTCGRSCLKHWANWPKKQTMLQDRKKTSFFRRRLLIRTNSIVYSFLKTRTHGKNGTKSTYEPTNHTWNSTPSQHFVHLQQNAMLISLRVAITAVTLYYLTWLVLNHPPLVANLARKSGKRENPWKSQNSSWMIRAL